MTDFRRFQIIALWRTGAFDTLDIAKRLGVKEWAVYNALARHREEQRERAA